MTLDTQPLELIFLTTKEFFNALSGAFKIYATRIESHNAGSVNSDVPSVEKNVPSRLVHGCLSVFGHAATFSDLFGETPGRVAASVRRPVRSFPPASHRRGSSGQHRHDFMNKVSPWQLLQSPESEMTCIIHFIAVAVFERETLSQVIFNSGDQASLKFTLPALKAAMRVA
jgi:hypothetical protein